MLKINTLKHAISSSHKTLYILCGFPYAGKTYIANKLQSETAIVYVSIDDIFHAYGFDWSTNTLPETKEWQDIFNESYERTKVALENGDNVLYDSTNQTIASRDRLREVATSVGAEMSVIYIKSSVEKVWKRWEENIKNPSRSVVSKDLVEMTIDMFEEPTDSEHVYTVNN